MAGDESEITSNHIIMNNYLLKVGLIVLAQIIGLGAASGQATIKGTVTDRQGDPLPGVKVTIKNSSVSALTDLDGTFSLNTYNTARKAKILSFDYGGYNKAKLKIKSNDTWIENADVKMVRSNAWNRIPGRHGNWLIGIESAFGQSFAQPAVGIMAGWCKRAGAYIKIGARPNGDAVTNYGDYDHWDYGPSYWWATDRTSTIDHFLGGGLIFRLGCALHLYVGAVWTGESEIYTIPGGEKIEYLWEGMNAGIDIGLMAKFRHFYLHGGVMSGCYTTGFINIGAGICL